MVYFSLNIIHLIEFKKKNAVPTKNVLTATTRAGLVKAQTNHLRWIKITFFRRSYNIENVCEVCLLSVTFYFDISARKR